MQKARRHSSRLLRPLASTWFQDLFHSSVRGSFHLSLTVLVHYRSLESIQPQRMVPPDSHRISRVPRYSGYCQASTKESCTGLSPSMIKLSSLFHFLVSCHATVLQPQNCRNNVGLGYSRFARHYFGNHFCFLLLWVLRCFSSPRSPST